MKKIMCLAAAAVIALTPSCRKVGQVADVSFSSPYSQDATVPDIPGYAYGDVLPAGGIDVSFPEYTLQTNTQKYFDDYHVSGKNVKSATFQYGTLTLLAGTNFDFLDKIEIYVSAEGLPEVLVAYQYNIPKGQKNVDLQPSGQNMREYIKHPTVNGRIQAHFNTVPAPGTRLNVTSEFNVVANALVNYDK